MVESASRCDEAGFVVPGMIVTTLGIPAPQNNIVRRPEMFQSQVRPTNRLCKSNTPFPKTGGNRRPLVQWIW